MGVTSRIVSYKYKAFISYSHQDEKVSTWLHKKLEGYRPPKNLVGTETPAGEVPARLAPVFRDRDELPTAAHLGDILQKAVTESGAQIVICSPDAARSHWVNEEILSFKRHGNGERIFCLIVAGEPYAANIPGREDEECFPPALRFELNDDGELGTTPAEPIAADLRPGKDGKNNALLKLIAGLLGVSFDALRQRDQQRRQRRLVAIASGATLGMVIAIGLATAALIARSEADRQRVRAESEAETARQTTNFLVDLFTVSDPSEARGNTITAREILDKGAARIKGELADQPAIQATLMDTMGTVYKSLGLYPESHALIADALSQRRQLYGDMHREVANSQAHLADVMTYQAEYAAALQHVAQALATQRELLGDRHPDVAASLVLSANIRSIQADFARAEEELREALDIQQESLGTESLVVAKTLEDLGMVMFDIGEYAEAEELVRESLQIRARLLQAEAHPQLAHGLQNLAVIMHTTGRYDEAEQLFQNALAMMQTLLGEDHHEITLVLSSIAFVLHDKGEFSAAQDVYLDVIKRLEVQLGEEHPETVRSRSNYAFLLYDMNEKDAAMDLAYELLGVHRRIFDPDHPEIAFSLTTLGIWLAEDDRVAEAEPILIESVEIARSIYDEDHPELGHSVAALAFMYLQTDRPDESLRMAAEASRIYADALSSDHWRTAWALNIQGAAMTRLEQYGDAEVMLLNSLADLETSDGVRPYYVDKALEHMSALYDATNRRAKADEYRARIGAEQSI